MIYVILITILIVGAFYITQNQDYKRAKAERIHEKIYQKAKSGNARAQMKMGMIAEMQGLFSQSEEWYLKAAKQGNVDAQEALGFLYSGFIKIFKDKEKEFYWMKLAAENGKLTAMYNLANIYLASKKHKDIDKALYWYKKSGKFGYVQMASLLSEKGDVAKALKYLKRAEKISSFYIPPENEEKNYLFGMVYSSEGKYRDLNKAKDYLRKNKDFLKKESEELLKEIDGLIE